jgi:UDP-N-acetylmuramoyl-L-alanyl-D-glutamate--2,6-diaminopimelate ligase
MRGISCFCRVVTSLVSRCYALSSSMRAQSQPRYTQDFPVGPPGLWLGRPYAASSAGLEVARIGDSEPRVNWTFAGSTEAYPRDEPFPRTILTPIQLVAVVPGGLGLHLPQEAADPARVRLSDMTHTSTQAGPEVLFACRAGQRADGHAFSAQAVAAGSPALLCERVLPVSVPQILVCSVAQAMGPAAAAIHGRPSHDLALIGVTGTSGKTTTTYLAESALRAAGHVTGLIGTVEMRVAGQPTPAVHTTPEASDLQRTLRRMVSSGVTGAAMEVSSHGLALGRVRGTRFAAAVFTNLGHDHLDFHRDLEEYFAAKATLFSPEFTSIGVVNIDDPWGRRLADSAPVEVRTVGLTSTGADCAVTALNAGPEGSICTARYAGRQLRLRTHLPGLFNVTNALCALVAAHAVGVDLDAAVAGIEMLQGVPGRMERVSAGQPFTVLVDYAHKPDALRNVLTAARDLVGGPRAGQVIVVVGCGGDRDRMKRSVMGRAAAELADFTVLTSDNPRTEDPLSIIDAMVHGAREVPGACWTVEVDRREAIACALRQARAGDVVVIAGKGHEPYQEVGDTRLEFDDRLVVRELLTQAEARG